MNFMEISNQKTYKQIIEQIIALIVNGELKNGDKLPGERALAEMLTTSRASIREAFRILEIIGIIEVRHGGGTYVREFHITPFLNTIAPLFLQNVDIMGDMMDFRIMLEGEAVKAAANSRNDDMIKNIEKAYDHMENPDPKIAEQADVDFHMAVFSATDNKAFALAGECLSYIVYSSIHTSRTKLVKDKAISARWLDEHRIILEAIKNRLPDQAADALRNHLEGVRTYILEKTIQEV